MGAKQYEEAFEQFTLSLDQEESTVALLLRGTAQERLGRTDAALKDYQRMVELAELSSDTEAAALGSFRIGNALIGMGKCVAAVEALSESIEFGETASVQAHFGRAECYVELREYDRALDDYHTVIELGDEQLLPSSYENLGYLHLLVEEPNSAIADFTELISLSPASATSYAGRFHAYIAAGECENAGLDMGVILEMDSTVATPKDISDLVSCHMKSGNREEIESLLSSGMASTSSPTLTSDMEELVDLLDRYLAITTEIDLRAELLRSKAFALYFLDSTEEVVTLLTEAIELEPNSSDSFGLRAAAFTRVLRAEDALADYLEALRLDPSDALLRVFVGDMYFATGELEKAVTYYESALNSVTLPAERRGQVESQIATLSEQLAGGGGSLCSWFVRTQAIRSERLAHYGDIAAWMQEHGATGFVSEDDQIKGELVAILNALLPFMEKFLQEWSDLGAHPEAEAFWIAEKEFIAGQIAAISNMSQGQSEGDIELYLAGAEEFLRLANGEASRLMLEVREQCLPH